MGASGERLIGATEACPPLFPYQVRTHLRSNRCPAFTPRNTDRSHGCNAVH